MEPIQIRGTQGEAESINQARKKADLDQKLEQNKLSRQAARETRMYVQGEEEKAPEEDYNLIDEYFTTTYADLQSRITDWAVPLQGAESEAITSYFDAIHAESWALREQVTNYQHAIPTGMFSKYQA